MGLRLGTGGAIPLETTLVDPAAAEEGQKITTYGSGSYSVEPWFAADTTAHQQPATTRPSICGTVRSTDVEVLGRYTHATSSSTEASLIRAEAERCSLVFAGTPGLPASLYESIAAAAGVHQYFSGSSAGDVSVEASGSAVFVHCGRGDAPCDGLTLHLPEAVGALFADELDGPMPQHDEHDGQLLSTAAPAAAGAAGPVCRNCASVACEPLAAGGVRVYWLVPHGSGAR